MRKRLYRAVVLSSLVVSSPCIAQSAAALAISAGSATDVTGVGSSALTIAPSFTRAAGLSSATFGASATRFANQAWSAGVSTAATARKNAGAITPMLDVAIAAATTSYDFSYATADLIPSLDARTGAARFFAGARLGAAGSSAMTGGPTAGSPLPVPGGLRASSSQQAATAIGGASLSSVGARGDVSTLGYRVETGQVAGARQLEQSVSASVAGSELVLAGALSHRARGASATTFGSATVAIAVMPSVMLQLSAGSYPENPMLGTAAGKFVNAGLLMRLGRRAGSLPEPAGVRAPGSGITRVAIRASDARRVELAGDFNKWKPVTAMRGDNGVWYVDLQLPPGEYRYAFRIDGKEWRVPEGVAAVDDEFGGKSAWLTVSRPASK